MAKIIYTSGAMVEVTPANGKSFDLKYLKDVVGGYIEAVYLTNGQVMFVNEEGKLKGLPINEAATIIIRSMGRFYPSNEYIAGDAIIVTPEEAGEKDTPEE